MFFVGFSGSIAENAHQSSAVKRVGLIEVIGALYFNYGPFACADVVPFQAHRIPGSTFFRTLGNRAKQNFLTVLFQIGLPFQFKELEGALKLISYIHGQSQK
jgi:hypothetical protein